jgi:hypothetical protein
VRNGILTWDILYLDGDDVITRRPGARFFHVRTSSTEWGVRARSVGRMTHTPSQKHRKQPHAK